jgi:hypothetical protein
MCTCRAGLPPWPAPPLGPPTRERVRRHRPARLRDQQGSSALPWACGEASLRSQLDGGSQVQLKGLWEPQAIRKRQVESTVSPQFRIQQCQPQPPQP